jgi:hypothetical protein
MAFSCMYVVHLHDLLLALVPHTKPQYTACCTNMHHVIHIMRCHHPPHHIHDGMTMGEYQTRLACGACDCKKFELIEMGGHGGGPHPVPALLLFLDVVKICSRKKILRGMVVVMPFVLGCGTCFKAWILSRGSRLSSRTRTTTVHRCHCPVRGSLCIPSSPACNTQERSDAHCMPVSSTWQHSFIQCNQCLLYVHGGFAYAKYAGCTLLAIHSLLFSVPH